MTGFALPLQAHTCPLPGLRALAELINEVLRTSDLPPEVAGPVAAPAVVAGPSLGHRPSTLNGARPRPGPGPGRVPDPGSAPDGGPAPGPPLHADSEQAAVWELVARAQAGDGEAFGMLYDRYLDTVFRFIYYRVNDRALAEDFTSETFLRALRRIGSISYQGRDIGAWFVTIARNIVLDHVKSARHRLETTTGDTLESREQAPSTEAAVLRTLDSERLMAAIEQLGDEQRECITLRFLHGMSVSETAEIMGKNDGAIKALQHRAVRKLATLVGGELR